MGRKVRLTEGQLKQIIQESKTRNLLMEMDDAEKEVEEARRVAKSYSKPAIRFMQMIAWATPFAPRDPGMPSRLFRDDAFKALLNTDDPYGAGRYEFYRNAKNYMENRNISSVSQLVDDYKFWEILFKPWHSPTFDIAKDILTRIVKYPEMAKWSVSDWDRTNKQNVIEHIRRHYRELN